MGALLDVEVGAIFEEDIDEHLLQSEFGDVLVELKAIAIPFQYFDHLPEFLLVEVLVEGLNGALKCR